MPIDPLFSSKVKLKDSPDQIGLKLFQANNKFRTIRYNGVPLSYAAAKAYLQDQARPKLDKSGGVAKPTQRILSRD